jgi:hypothetical protein
LGWNATDQACHESWSRWNSAHLEWEDSLPRNWKTSIQTPRFRIGKGLGDGATYTACDGIPRFRFFTSPTSTTYDTVTITTSERFGTRPPGSKFSIFEAIYPSPRCNIDPEHCSTAQTSYRQERLTSGLDGFNYAAWEEVYLGACRIERMTSCYLIAGSEVVLIYWPPVLTSRDVCAANGYGTAITEPVQTRTKPLVVTTSAITFQGIGIARLERAFRLF